MKQAKINWTGLIIILVIIALIWYVIKNGCMFIDMFGLSKDFMGFSCAGS